MKLRRTFTQEDVDAFAELTGDKNPLHLDPEKAAEGRFGRRVVHGALTASLIPTYLATLDPGPGTILVSMEVDFLHPVHPGEEVVLEGSHFYKDRFHFSGFVGDVEVLRATADVILPDGERSETPGGRVGRFRTAEGE